MWLPRFVAGYDGHCMNRFLVGIGCCVLPLFIVAPIAAISVSGGPCAGIRNGWAGAVLFLSSISGLAAGAFGFIQLGRARLHSLRSNLIRILSFLVGFGTLALNGFMALLSGMSIAAMLHIAVL
jgi:hypothetical protein